MKQNIFFIGSAVAMIALAAFCFLGKDLCTTVCSVLEKPQSNLSTVCSKCGKNSCDKNCTSSSLISTTMSGKLLPTCNLTTEESSAREKFLKETIFKKINSVNAIENGYDLVFLKTQDFRKELEDFINFEKKCCTGLSFGLTFNQNNNTAHLQIIGSKETKEDLASSFKQMGLIK